MWRRVAPELMVAPLKEGAEGAVSLEALGWRWRRLICREADQRSGDGAGAVDQG